MRNPFESEGQPDLKNPSLIVGWQEDAGRVGAGVIEYLCDKIKAKSFCEIGPEGFFSLGGAAIRKDVALFPRCTFYCGDRSDVVLFGGNEPEFERFRFLHTLLDVAEHHCEAKELFTINGTVSSIAHSSERKILTVCNQSQFQNELFGYGPEAMTWEGTPAISSYLLWVAERRGIKAASLWTTVPFYLAAVRDPRAMREILTFLDRKFTLQLDLSELDKEIKKQDARIARLRQEDADIDKSIGLLEARLSLDEQEQMELAKRVTQTIEQDRPSLST
jgi:proteasome assembly chaperone (PAC2) family protein